MLRDKQSKNIEHRLIANELNINYERLVQSIGYMDSLYDISKIMILTWYSADMKDDNGLYISNNKFERLKNNIDLDINDLVGLFKSGNSDTLIDILKYEKYYVMGMIKKQLVKYNLVIPYYQYKELYDFITFELIKCINNSALRYPGQIVNYMRISIMYRTLDYIVKNIFNKSYSYLDEIAPTKSYDFIEF